MKTGRTCKFEVTISADVADDKNVDDLKTELQHWINRSLHDSEEYVDDALDVDSVDISVDWISTE